MRRLPDGRLGAQTTFTEHYASYPGIVHGGIVNVLVDEVMGDMLALEHGMLVFSVTLRTKMLLPLRVGVAYLAVAQLVGAGNGVLHTQADVTGADGQLHVVANGTYQPIRSEQARALMGLDNAGLERLRHYFDHEIGST